MGDLAVLASYRQHRLSNRLPAGSTHIALRCSTSRTENSKDSLGYLADGLTEGLIRELDQVQGLDVISKGGVAPFRGDSVSPDSVARALHAGTLVSGALERQGSNLRVTIRLVDGGSGADFERASFEQPAGNLLAVQDTLAQKVAEPDSKRLGEEIRLREQQREGLGTSRPGRWCNGRHGTRRRRKTPAEKARYSRTRSRVRTGRFAASLGRPLDPTWAEPIVEREMIAYRRSRLSADDPLKAARWIENGLRHAERALSSDPRILTPWSCGATFVTGVGCWGSLLTRAQAKASVASAQADLEAAVKIAPSQAGAWSTLSHLYYQCGDLM